MPIRVDAGERVIRFVFDGATPARDIYAIFHRAFEETTGEREILADLRGSTSLADRTPEFVRMLTEFVVQHPKRPGRHVAVVLPADERERWSKMTASMAEGTNCEIRIFESDDEAGRWLSGTD